jgi:hypothetical protein
LDAQGISVTFCHNTVLTFRTFVAVEGRDTISNYRTNFKRMFKIVPGQKQGVFMEFFRDALLWSQAGGALSSRLSKRRE